ncbi:MAG: nucleotidyltransferase family protein [Candidatus Poribacteria bacterium]|nr:nucleotidyltransferase family protein [Candidatus Poribacteria bacterium]
MIQNPIEHRILLLCATSWLFPEDKELLENLLREGNFSWRKILFEAKKHDMVPLLYANFKDFEPGLIDEEIISEIKRHYHRVTSTNIMFHSELVKLQRLFSDAGIPTIVLKGMILIRTVYTDIGLRPMCDLDLLAKPTDWTSINKILRSQGYTTTENYNLLREGEVYDYSFCFGASEFVKHGPIDVALDLHFNPIWVGNIAEESLWSRTTVVKEVGVDMLCLCPEHQLAHLCVHLNHHNYMLLKWFVDIYALLHRYKEDLDWHYIIEKFANTGTGVSIYYSLLLTRRLLGSIIPDWVLKPLTPSVTAKKLFEGTWDIEEISQLHNPTVKHPDFRMAMMLTKRFRNKYKFIRNNIFPPLRWLRCRYNDFPSKDIWRLYFLHYWMIFNKNNAEVPTESWTKKSA